MRLLPTNNIAAYAFAPTPVPQNGNIYLPVYMKNGTVIKINDLSSREMEEKIRGALIKNYTVNEVGDESYQIHQEGRPVLGEIDIIMDVNSVIEQARSNYNGNYKILSDEFALIAPLFALSTEELKEQLKPLMLTDSVSGSNYINVVRLLQKTYTGE